MATNQEKYQMISYKGNQITLFSDGFNDYISLGDMARAWKYRKTICGWLKYRKTIEFLCAWEKRYNCNFSEIHLSPIFEFIKKNKSLSVDFWIRSTNPMGIFIRQLGIFAHEDIAMRYAGWLSSEFELYLKEEIQRLKKIENKVNSDELSNEAQILFLIYRKR